MDIMMKGGRRQICAFYEVAHRLEIGRLNFSIQAAQLAERVSGLFFVWRISVPFEFVFHKVDSLACDGMSDNAYRMFDNRLCFVCRIDNCFHIMPVNLNNLPAERFVVISQALFSHNGLCRTVYLDIVSVDDCSEVG